MLQGYLQTCLLKTYWFIKTAVQFNKKLRKASIRSFLLKNKRCMIRLEQYCEMSLPFAFFNKITKKSPVISSTPPPWEGSTVHCTVQYSTVHYTVVVVAYIVYRYQWSLILFIIIDINISYLLSTQSRNMAAPRGLIWFSTMVLISDGNPEHQAPA